jgi:hypothetical protein
VITGRALSAAVTGDVAVRETATGLRFARTEDHERKDSTQELSRREAEAIANFWLRTFGRFQKSFLEATAGRAITIDRLAACSDQARYATSAAVLESRSSSRDLRIRRGSWWLVPVCDGRSRLAVVAVSAHAPKALAHPKPFDRLPSLADSLLGNEFKWYGLAEGSWIALEPERAAIEVAARTNRRVRRVPELVTIPGFPYGPFHSVWRVELESTAQVRLADGRDTRDSVLYVGGTNDDAVAPGVGFFLGASEVPGVRSPARLGGLSGADRMPTRPFAPERGLSARLARVSAFAGGTGAF